MTKHIAKDTYYAVIFTSKLSIDTTGYEEMSKKIEDLVKTQKGFLGVETAREARDGITVSYWETMEDIKNWSTNERHLEAKKGGKEKWYDSFTIKICEVKREYAFGK